jgi:hypothetical protein
VIIFGASLLSLTRVIEIFHDGTLPSRDELLRIFMRVVRNELPVRIYHVIPWGRIQTWDEGFVF